MQWINLASTIDHQYVGREYTVAVSIGQGRAEAVIDCSAHERCVAGIRLAAQVRAIVKISRFKNSRYNEDRSGGCLPPPVPFRYFLGV